MSETNDIKREQIKLVRQAEIELVNLIDKYKGKMHPVLMMNLLLEKGVFIGIFNAPDRYRGLVTIIDAVNESINIANKPENNHEETAS